MVNFTGRELPLPRVITSMPFNLPILWVHWSNRKTILIQGDLSIANVNFSMEERGFKKRKNRLSQFFNEVYKIREFIYIKHL